MRLAVLVLDGVVLGKSPLSYFQSLRIERAVHLLKTSSASVEEVAERVGTPTGRR